MPHDVKIYDEVGHSYMNRHPKWLVALAPFTPLRARYDEAAAEDSWRRMLAFFRTHLGPPRKPDPMVGHHERDIQAF